jgi:uncharacterized protein YdgA (DUF945 family)
MVVGLCAYAAIFIINPLNKEVKMKKVLIFVVVLIVAVAVIGPKFVGSQLKDGIQNTVDVINKNPTYTASIKRLESTWFTTTAEISVGLYMPELAGQEAIDASIDLSVTSHHGPILTADGLALAWLHTVVQTQNIDIPDSVVVANNKPLYQFTGITNLFGSTVYDDEVAAINYTDPQSGGIVSFSGLQGKGEISSSGLTYKAAIDNLNMAVENAANFDLQSFSVTFTSSESLTGMMSKGLYDSNSSMSVDLITFNDIAQGTEVRIVDTKIVARSDYDKPTDLGNVEVITTLASLDATDMNLTDLSATLELNNLQARFLLAYQDFSNQIMANINDPVKIEDDLQAFMQEYLLAQLQAKPEYNISKLSGKINGSEFDGKIMAKIDGVTDIPKTLDDPAFWMQHTVLDSKIVMQKGAAEFIAAQVISSQLAANPQFLALSEEEQAQILAQQIPATLSGLVQQGLITLEEETYTSIFTMENGAAMLNGNPIPL